MDLSTMSIVKLVAYPILGVSLFVTSLVYASAIIHGDCGRKTIMALMWLNAANAVCILLSLVTDLLFL